MQGQAPRPDAPNIVCKIRPRQTLSWTRTCLSQTGSGCCLMFTWAHRPRIGLPLPSDPTRPDLAPARAALACGVQPSGSTLCGGILDVLCTDRPVWSKGPPTMLDVFLRPPARPPAHSHRHPPTFYIFKTPNGVMCPRSIFNVQCDARATCPQVIQIGVMCPRSIFNVQCDARATCPQVTQCARAPFLTYNAMPAPHARKLAKSG